MKRKSFFVVISVALVGFLVLIIASGLFKKPQDVKQQVIETAQLLMIESLPGVEIQGTMIQPSTKHVNFTTDELFEMTIIYVFDGDYKQIMFHVGIFKDKIIIPSEMDILMLHNKAPVITSRP